MDPNNPSYYSNPGNAAGAGGGLSYPRENYNAATSFALMDASAARAYAASSASAPAGGYYSSSDDDDALMPWERDGWRPCAKSGKQKTPNVIRNELQRYIDQCKADGSSTQTAIIERMGVNNNTFRRYMNPGTYKNQWSATQNGTYWAGAKLLAEVAYEKELAKKSGKGKRKSGASAADGSSKKAKTAEDSHAAEVPRKKSSAELKLEAMQLIQRIDDVEGVPEGIVYDTCPIVVSKIKQFLLRDGITKANLLLAFGSINSNSLNTFLSGKKQDQCGNVTYRRAYVFFEKLRILEGKKKTAARLRNELDQPLGFSLEKARPVRYLWGLPGRF